MPAFYASRSQSAICLAIWLFVARIWSSWVESLTTGAVAGDFADVVSTEPILQCGRNML